MEEEFDYLQSAIQWLALIFSVALMLAILALLVGAWVALSWSPFSIAYSVIVSLFGVRLSLSAVLGAVSLTIILLFPKRIR